MDTTKLVVGQEIRMRSGSLVKEAVVTDITPEYIEATPVSFGDEGPWMIRFQRDGKQFNVQELVARMGSYVDWKYLGNLGVYDWTCRGWERHDPRPECGDGGHPWELIPGPDESGPVAN